MNLIHESIFNYSVTRPYPFKWFTPVALIGVLVATILFSFLNFASNGYDLIVQNSSNPNQTISEGLWFKNWPSFLAGKVKPTCESVDIHVNTLLFTNQTALTYTLTDVWQMQGKNRSILPSLTYFNNPIEQCAISSVEMDLSALDRAANQFAYSEWGASVRVYISCIAYGPSGQVNFSLSTAYDYVPSTVSFSNTNRFLGTNFVNRNNETRASLYWGESLMSMYWAYMTRTMQDIRVNTTQSDHYAIRTGTISFTPSNVSDITDLGFFEVDFRFVIDQGAGNYDVIAPQTYNVPEVSSINHLQSITAYPNIWIQADSLAKSTYSTILTDLGQTSSKPNILVDGDILQYFTSNFSLALSHIANAIPGPATENYETLKATTGPLGITPSVFSTNYICQIPRLKSGGNLFLAVLIADIVFLQALWKVFTMVTNWLMLRKRPDLNQCQHYSGAAAGHQILLDEFASGSQDHGIGQFERLEQGDLDEAGTPKRKAYHRATSSQQVLLS